MEGKGEERGEKAEPTRPRDPGPGRGCARWVAGRPERARVRPPARAPELRDSPRGPGGAGREVGALGSRWADSKSPARPPGSPDEARAPPARTDVPDAP